MIENIEQRPGIWSEYRRTSQPGRPLPTFFLNQTSWNWPSHPPLLVLIIWPKKTSTRLPSSWWRPTERKDPISSKAERPRTDVDTSPRNYGTPSQVKLHMRNECHLTENVDTPRGLTKKIDHDKYDHNNLRKKTECWPTEKISITRIQLVESMRGSDRNTGPHRGVILRWKILLHTPFFFRLRGDIWQCVYSGLPAKLLSSRLRFYIGPTVPCGMWWPAGLGVPE